jgi:hypothetical protein
VNFSSFTKYGTQTTQIIVGVAGGIWEICCTPDSTSVAKVAGDVAGDETYIKLRNNAKRHIANENDAKIL